MAKGRDPGFQVIAKLTDQFTGPINRVNRSIAESTAKMRAMAAVPGAIARASGLDKIGGAVSNLGGSLLNLRNAAASVVAPFARLATVGLGAGLVAGVTSAVKLGSELTVLSDRTNISIESLQRLRYAYEQAGVPAENFTSNITKLSQAIAQARKGGKKNEMLEMFNAMEISLKDLQTLAPEQIFYKVTQAIADVSDPVHKTTGAMKAFGKAGAESLPLFNMGADWIQKMGDEIASTGGVMDDFTARQARAFSDVMTKTKGYLQGISFAVLGQLLPSMNKSATAFDEFLGKNRDKLISHITEAIRGLVAAGKALYSGIKAVVPIFESLEPVWTRVTKAIGKGNAVLLVMTAVIAPGVIGALAGIAKAVLALGWAVVANPVGAAIVAIVAAIAAAGYLIWKYWDDIVGAFKWAWEGIKSVGDQLGQVWTEVSAGFSNAFGTLGTNIAAAWADIEATFWGALAWIGDFGGKIVAAVTGWIAPVITPVVQLGADILAAITGWLAPVITRVVQLGADILAAVTGWIAPVITPVVQLGADILAAITGWLAPIVSPFAQLGTDIAASIGRWWDAIRAPIDRLVDNLKRALTAPIEWIKAQWEGLIASLKGIPGKVGEAVSGVAGRAAGAVSGAATGAWNWLTGGGGAPAAPAPPANAPPLIPTMPAIAMPGGVAESHAVIDFNIGNAPPGSRGSVRTTSGNTEVNLHTQYAGPIAEGAV